MTRIINELEEAIKIAYGIKDRIKNKLKFLVNIEIRKNKFCAKMSSDFEKLDKVDIFKWNA